MTSSSGDIDMFGIPMLLSSDPVSSIREWAVASEGAVGFEFIELYQFLTVEMAFYRRFCYTGLDELTSDGVIIEAPQTALLEASVSNVVQDSAVESLDAFCDWRYLAGRYGARRLITVPLLSLDDSEGSCWAYTLGATTGRLLSDTGR